MPCQLMFQILELGEVSSGRGNLVRGCPWCWGSAQFGSVNLHSGANKYSLPYSLPSRQLAVTRAVLPHPHMHVCTFPTQPNMSKKSPPYGNHPPVSCECAIMLKNLFCLCCVHLWVQWKINCLFGASVVFSGVITNVADLSASFIIW